MHAEVHRDKASAEELRIISFGRSTASQLRRKAMPEGLRLKSAPVR